jgi:FkbM family methyltransferase
MRFLLTYLPKITGPLRAYYNMFFGEKEIKYLKKYINSKKYKYTFIDIGANYGIYSFIFGPKASVLFVVEPIKECIDYIRKGYLKSNVKFYEGVISNDNLDKNLSVPISNKRYIYGKSSIDNKFENSSTLRVKSFKLENFEKYEDIKESELLFIKIDVEGHENHVLQEAGKLLSHLKTLLMIEIEERHNSNYILLFKRLEEKGFKAYYLSNKDLVEIVKLENLSLIMKTNINFIFKNY